MASVVAKKTQSNARHRTVAAGAFIVMIGASIVLSGLLLITAPIISDLYYQKDAAGRVLLRTLPSGAKVPVEINGGQGAFLIYFSILTSQSSSPTCSSPVGCSPSTVAASCSLSTAS